MTAALVVGGAGYAATEILNHSTRYVPPPEPAPTADDDLYGGSAQWRALCEGKATPSPEPSPVPVPTTEPTTVPSPGPSGDGQEARELVVDTLVLCPEGPLDWEDRLGEWR